MGLSNLAVIVTKIVIGCLDPNSYAICAKTAWVAAASWSSIALVNFVIIKFNAFITLFDTATRLLNATISDYLASLIFYSYELIISNYVSNVFIV